MGWFFVTVSPKKCCRRLKQDDAPDTKKTGDDDNKKDATACQCDALPHQNDSSGGYFLEGHFKESGGHACAYSETHHPNGECLQQHHTGQPPVRDAYGLQSADLLQVFHR